MALVAVLLGGRALGCQAEPNISGAAVTPDQLTRASSSLPEADEIMVRAVLDGVGRIADAGEATTQIVQEMRRELAQHGSREEVALIGVERFLAGLAEAQARATGTAAAAAAVATARAEEDAAKARAVVARVLTHPALVAIAVAVLMQIAAYYGVSIAPPALSHPHSPEVQDGPRSN